VYGFLVIQPPVGQSKVGRREIRKLWSRETVIGATWLLQMVSRA
jgi:hypothetical protein